AQCLPSTPTRRSPDLVPYFDSNASTPTFPRGVPSFRCPTRRSQAAQHATHIAVAPPVSVLTLTLASSVLQRPHIRRRAIYETSKTRRRGPCARRGGSWPGCSPRIVRAQSGQVGSHSFGAESSSELAASLSPWRCPVN